MVTFLLSGLWHGANSTFLIWGGLHGGLLVAEKKFKPISLKYLKIPLVFLLTSILWLPFRAKTYTHLLELLKELFSFTSFGAAGLSKYFLSAVSFYKLIVLSVVFLFFMMMEYGLGKGDFNDWISGRKKWMRISFYYLLFILILMLGNFDVKPYFIYFQF